MLNQTFDPGDLATIGLLVLLEGVLSVDNALVLGVLAARVPAHLAGRALAYGLAGALVFRLIAVALATYLLSFSILQPIGAAYLIYLVARRFVFKSSHPRPDDNGHAPFWRSVLAIELTDLAFAIDNVLAAVALVGPAPVGSGLIHPKLWVILTGGMLGVILTRYAAAVCIRLLRGFPRLEVSGYCIVLLVACKLALEWLGVEFRSVREWPFWAFWILLVTLLAMGLTGRRSSPLPEHPPAG